MRARRPARDRQIVWSWRIARLAAPWIVGGQRLEQRRNVAGKSMGRTEVRFGRPIVDNLVPQPKIGSLFASAVEERRCDPRDVPPSNARRLGIWRPASAPPQAGPSLR